MSVAREDKLRNRTVLIACAALWSFVGAYTASAQSGGLDMDVDSHAPIAAKPTVEAVAPENAPANPAPAAAPDQGPAQVTASLDNLRSSNATAAQSVMPEALTLDHPTIINTAKLKAGETIVSLFGIEGLTGESAVGLQGYLQSTSNHLTCQAQVADGFVCLLSDGTDLAQVALINGAARTSPDAPDSYREQEAAAQAARRGIWINLPPPPETLNHPSVPDTAALAAAGRTYVLDGLEGLGQPYASQLQGYIAANGDSLTCSLQKASGRYICVLPDGTDIAKVALVNGAARVAADAPDAYRIQQSEALSNRRGYWLNPPPDAVTAALAVTQPEQFAFVAGDDGADGVTYVGGAPTALIDGEAVFLVYGDDAGWGYYDHWHHWHGAPDHYRMHMEHYHPYGHGLRGYRDEAAFHREGAFRHDEAMHHDAVIHHDEAIHHDAVMRHDEALHHDAVMRHDEALHHDAMIHHDEALHPGGVHPVGMAARPAALSPVAHSGAMPGGGFVHPEAIASAGGFHPGGGAPGLHAGMPTMHAAPAPAMHANLAGGAPKKH